MARFEFFDSYATYTSQRTESSYSTRTYVEQDNCGDPGSTGSNVLSESASGNTTKFAEIGFLTASFSARTINDALGFTQTDVTASTQLSRSHATSPTYSFTWTPWGTDASSTGTGTGVGGAGDFVGRTLRTTGTTTQSVSARETTTATTAGESPLSGLFVFGDYLDSADSIFAWPSVSFPFGSTTQSTGMTLIISTTLAGYVFAQPVQDAAFLYALDPYGASSRANSALLTQHPRSSPAYWVTTPLSEGTSFSATQTTGTHQVFSIGSLFFSGGFSEGTNFVEYCDEEQTIVGGGQSSSSGYGETLPAWKTYETQTFNPINQYQRKRLSTYYYIDPLADPTAAPIYTSYTLNNSTLALSITANSYDLFVVVSQHAGNNCYTPAYFTGIRPGTTGVKTGVSTTATRRVNVSWLSTSAIGFTAKTSTASTDTVSSQVGFMKSSAQTSDYVTATEAMDIYFPPYVFRTGTEFEPVASYGVSAGTYKLASTNSTGGTTSQTSSGIVSSTVPSSVYGRPHRKIAYSYAITTSSGTLTGFDGYLVNEYTWQPGGQAVFTSLYGGVAGYSRAAVSVEESRGDNLGSRRVF